MSFFNLTRLLFLFLLRSPLSALRSHRGVVRVEVPTYPQSCNSEQGQGMPEPHEPNLNPESLPFLVHSRVPVIWSVPKSWLSLVSWTALRFWLRLVRAPVRIWPNAMCSSCKPMQNESVPERFRITEGWGVRLAGWVRYLLRG